MQDGPEDLTRTLQVLSLTVKMIAESLNAYTLAIEELNKRIEALEQFMGHEQ